MWNTKKKLKTTKNKDYMQYRNGVGAFSGSDSANFFLIWRIHCLKNGNGLEKIYLI